MKNALLKDPKLEALIRSLYADKEVMHAFRDAVEEQHEREFDAINRHFGDISAFGAWQRDRDAMRDVLSIPGVVHMELFTRKENHVDKICFVTSVLVREHDGPDGGLGGTEARRLAAKYVHLR